MHGTAYSRHPYQPAEEYWDEDLRLIEEHGLDIIRVWVLWSDVEPEEGVFDVERYRRLFDRAHQHGLKVMPNFILETAPHWAYRKHPDARYFDMNDVPFKPAQFACGPAGGWPGLCLDSEAARLAAGRFLRHFVRTFAFHPALGTWDIWNEPITEPVRAGGGTWASARQFEMPLYCYCPGTVGAFRGWLRARYNDTGALNQAWGTVYRGWELVEPPRFPATGPAWVDWKSFLRQRLTDQARWKAQIVREEDGGHPVIMHAPSFCGGPTDPQTFDVDDWQLQRTVDGYGVSFYHTIWFRPTEPDPAGWMYVFDGVRSACLAGKGGQYHMGEFQCTDSAGNLIALETPEWLLWAGHIAALACCTTGIVYWQWRPEVLGSEASLYGLVGVDGKPRLGAAVARRFSQLLARLAPTWENPRLASRVAMLYDPKIYYHCYADGRGRTDLIKHSLEGWYKLAWDLDVPVDIVHEEFVDDAELARYDVLIMPFPMQVNRRTAELVAGYVRRGGRVIAEAYLGRFRDLGWGASRVPCHGLDEVFGCRTAASFAAEDTLVRWRGPHGSQVRGCEIREGYEPISGTVEGYHADGSPAVVTNRFGKGSTVLVGTLVGKAYRGGRDQATRDCFASLLPSETAVRGVESPTTFSARLVHCDRADYLFLVNFGDREERPEVVLPVGRCRPRLILGDGADPRWEPACAGVAPSPWGGTLRAVVPPRSAAIVGLEGGREDKA